MKKITQIFSLLFLTVLMVSCDNESESNDPIPEAPNNSEILTSITINSTWVDYVETFNLENNKITDKQFSDGSYHLYTYSGDKVSQINEYDANDNILFSKSFSYDVDSRLIQRIITPNTLLTEWENYVTYNYSYIDNTIVGVYKVFDFNNVQQGDEQIRNLDLEQNNIVKSVSPVLSLPFRDEATYLNGNPMTFTHYFSGSPIQQATYEYLNDVAADAYFIEKYKFGIEWKNNSLLNQGQSSLGTYMLNDIGVNYLSSLYDSFNYQEQSFNNITTYSYEFDDDNLLLSQTQTKNHSNSDQTYVTVITYEYE